MYDWWLLLLSLLEQCKWTKYANQHSYGASPTSDTTLDACQNTCSNTRYCVSIDFDTVAKPNGCWIFTDGNLNRPLYESLGVDYYQLNADFPTTTTTTKTTMATTTSTQHLFLEFYKILNLKRKLQQF